MRPATVRAVIPVQRPRWRLLVDPIRCTGRGLCAEIVPELIQLDDWGYPMVAAGPVSAAVLRHARRAVAACPELALVLEKMPPSERMERAVARDNAGSAPRRGVTGHPPSWPTGARSAPRGRSDQ